VVRDASPVRADGLRVHADCLHHHSHAICLLWFVMHHQCVLMACECMLIAFIITRTRSACCGS
jgi:hypothetical protein